MNIKQPQDKSALLDFALEVYAQPELEALCLKLQDSYGGQVNVLLWAAWLDALSLPLDRTLLERACAAIRIQERYWLRPLRFFRRAIPRTCFRWRALIKALELRAEFWQLRCLAGYLPELGGGMGVGEASGGGVQEGYRLQYLQSLNTPGAFQSRVMGLAER